MALPEELYDTPASRLDSFLAQRLQPSREWKEEVLEAVKAVEQFLREEPLEGACWPDQEVRVLKLVKVGSFGTGTALRGVAEVRLVAFLSGFRSFQEAARCHQAALRLLRRALWTCRDLLDLGLEGLEVAPGVPDALAFTIWTRWTAEPVTVTIVPAYRALGPSAPSSPPPPEVYERLAAACPDPGRLSPSFCELQRDFVKYRPTKLKGLLRLVKHWFLRYVKARSPRAALPPLYALELLTVYAWEVGTQESESFGLDEGLTTVMELLQEPEGLCIFWTTYYTLQSPVVEAVVRQQLQRARPIILDPADPTHNVAEGYRWDIVAQKACQCLKQDCCYDSEDNPVPSWNVKKGSTRGPAASAPSRGVLQPPGIRRPLSVASDVGAGSNVSSTPYYFYEKARDIQLTVEQGGRPDCVLTVNPYDPIRKVKEKIWRGQCCSGVQQRLSFQTPGGERKLLGSRGSLAKFGIFCDTRVYLLETIPPEIQVFVKNPEGGSHAYAIDPDSYVLGLKQQIEDRQGLLRKQQELQFLGQVLQDWSALGSYGIKDSDTLILSKKRDTDFPFLPCCLPRGTLSGCPAL